MGRIVTMDEKLFSEGNDKETWKQIEPERWLNPAFQNFVSREIIGEGGVETLQSPV
jgi:hypothetical protein